MKTLAYVLILITLFYMFPSPTEASISATAIEDARYDAQRDISKELWFFTGCCLGGVGYTIAFLTTPELPVHRFMGKPPEYVFSISKNMSERRRDSKPITRFGDR